LALELSHASAEWHILLKLKSNDACCAVSASLSAEPIASRIARAALDPELRTLKVCSLSELDYLKEMEVAR
jgi:hypothetical protein